MNSGCRMVAMSEARLTEGRTEHAKTPKATVGLQRTTRGAGLDNKEEFELETLGALVIAFGDRPTEYLNCETAYTKP